MATFTNLTAPPANIPDPASPSTYDLYAYPFMAWLKIHGIEMQTKVDELNAVEQFAQPKTNINQTFIQAQPYDSGSNAVFSNFTALPFSSGTHGGSPTLFSDGCLLIKSSTTANSGVSIRTETGIFSLSSDNMTIFVSTLSYRYATNTTVKMGLGSVIDTSDASDSVYFKIVGTSVYAACRNDGVETITIFPFSLVQNNIYKFKITIDGITSALFSIYDENGGLLGSLTISTNLPNTTHTDVMGAGIVAWNSGTAVQSLIAIAHIGLKTYSKTTKTFW